MEEHLLSLKKLAIALALGLLIGLERSWSGTRWEPQAKILRCAEISDRRIAGIRTFGLIALFGALTALTGTTFPLFPPLAFLGLVALLTAMAVLEAHHIRDFGITTPVAALITFLLGVWVAWGQITVATTVAVTTTILLSVKRPLHRWVENLTDEELYAVLKLLLISVVLLPILPRQPIDPWRALNPYEIWWMVVLISGISFVGYFAIKIAGPRRGLVTTGLLGGLTSSTAVTLSFSRLAQKSPRLAPLLAASILAACSTMFPRVVFIVAVVAPELGERLMLPLLTAAVVGYGAALWLFNHSTDEKRGEGQLVLRNPFEFGEALKFGLFLILILWLAKVLEQKFGHAGLFAVAALSGVSDVDAISLSVAHLSRIELDLQTARQAILLAAGVNTFVKGAIALIIGGARLARFLLPIFALQIAAASLLLK